MLLLNMTDIIWSLLNFTGSLGYVGRVDAMFVDGGGQLHGGVGHVGL